MEFGVVLQPNPPASGLIAMMKRAEAGGFGYGWTFDSHVLWQETFVLYPRILESTSTMIVGPMVTNPGTRDWSVIASMFATLNDSFGNRTICGIGRGDSARRYIGLPPVSLSTLSSAMTVIKELAEGREVEHHGQPLRIPWVRSGSLPIWMAAYGPKALRLVGEQADGFILQTADPDIARWTFAAVRAAALDAGRDPASITMCVAAPASMYYIEGRSGYDYSHHGRAGNPSAEFVPDSIVDRFCLVGPAEAHIERLAELASIGADQFALYLMHDDEENTLDSYAEEIIPALR
jgi:probable F420-dependent oxidoreductase